MSNDGLTPLLIAEKYDNVGIVLYLKTSA